MIVILLRIMRGRRRLFRESGIPYTFGPGDIYLKGNILCANAVVECKILYTDVQHPEQPGSREFQLDKEKSYDHVTFVATIKKSFISHHT